MPPYWGVDSYSAANRPVRVPRAFLRPGESGTVRESLYDYVTRRGGQEPRFWGRYLNASLGSRLQPGEKDFIFERSNGRCRIALIYNGIRERPQRGAAGRARGIAAAQEAIRLARQNRVPANVRIYLDLEGWPVNPELLEGWWDTIHGSHYAGAGGLYGRGAEVRTRRRSHMPDLTRRIHSSGWARRVPDAEDAMAARDWSGLVNDLATGHSGKPWTRYIWSNTPRRADLHRDTPAGTEIIPSGFGAVGPSGSMLTNTVIWQYRFGAFWAEGGRRGTVDLDLALERAYQNMWSR